MNPLVKRKLQLDREKEVKPYKQVFLSLTLFDNMSQNGIEFQDAVKYYCLENFEQEPVIFYVEIPNVIIYIKNETEIS